MKIPMIHLGLSGRARRHVGQAFCAARQPMPCSSAPAGNWRRMNIAPEFSGAHATGLAAFASKGDGSATGTATVKYTTNRHTRPLGTRLT